MAPDKLEGEDLERFVDEAVERSVERHDGVTLVDNADNADGDETADLLTHLVTANSPLDAETLEGEPEGLLRELAQEFVPQIGANADLDEIRGAVDTTEQAKQHETGLVNPPGAKLDTTANEQDPDEAGSDDYSAGVLD